MTFWAFIDKHFDSFAHAGEAIIVLLLVFGVPYFVFREE